MTAILLYLLLQLGAIEGNEKETVNKEKDSTEQTFTTSGGTGAWQD